MRTRRRLLAIAGLIAMLAMLGIARPAHAADDRIDTMSVEQTMTTAGVLQVEETIEWRFGSTGRHGIERYLVTREAYDDEQDAVYTISDIEVSSPTGAPDAVSTSTVTDGRDEKLRIRIGDPNQTVSGPTETYVISYEVTGAMRTFSGYDEFYWDIGAEFPEIGTLRVSTTVPGGAQEVSCFAGPVGSKDPCATAEVSSGRAVFQVNDLAAGDNMSIGVKIGASLVSDNAPHLEQRADQATRTATYAGIGAGLVSLIAAPLLGMAWWRRHGVDERYQGLAPGTVPVRGSQAPVGPSDSKLTIPVSFSPPPISVAEAGTLIDGTVDVRETTATLIDLAVRGAIKVEGGQRGRDTVLHLVDPSVARAPHETQLLYDVFGRSQTATLGKRGSLTTGHDNLVSSVRRQVRDKGWYRRMPSLTAATSFGGGGCIVAAVFGFWMLPAFGGMASVLVGGMRFYALLLLPLIPILITLGVIAAKRRKGRRSADGRAVTDLIEGFRLYLTTAEADQLRFEEGEDIFSKYLPWAIMFDITARWTRVCQQLIAQGRLADTPPSWYYGDIYMWHSFNVLSMNDSLNTASTPMPQVSAGSSTSGFGGGSSFGGGGFSGGGGGGGGAGSW